ncbi:MAG: phosphatase PAP2 family protein [Bacteroidales bacterium]|nr:phosphatase PAP2 family protein [Bacteroidales bacterium]
MNVRNLFVTCGVLMALAADVAAQELPEQGIASPGMDFRVLQQLEEHRTPAMTHVMSWTSNSLVLAPAIPIGMMGAGWAADNRDLLYSGCVTGLSLATAFALSEGLKWSIQRPRPYLAYPDELHPVRTTLGYSFPSEHTSLTFAVATSLSLCYPKWYVVGPSILWAAGVGFSRLYLGVHYPSDVLSGALVGTASALLVYGISQNLRKDAPQPAAAVIIPVAVAF